MRKLLISLVATSFCFSGPIGTLGDLLDIQRQGGVSGWLSGAVYELEVPSSFETQTHSLYYGGGIRLRTRDYNFQPFSVIPPKISAGCGGVDLVFGGFGYFQPEYLVEFGKQVIQQAPAYAFKTALEIFCPSCQKIMTELENLANLINSLQLNSCQVAATLTDSAGNWIREKVGNIDVAQGAYQSYLKAKEKILQKTGLAVLEEATQKGAVKSEIVKLILRIRQNGTNPVSLADHILPELAGQGRASSLFTIREIQAFVKEAFGDVRVYIPDTSDEDFVVQIVKPQKKLDVSDVVEAEGKTQVCITPGCVSLKVLFVKPQVDEIVNKILTKTPLSANELNFLAAFPFPAYKLINWASTSPGILTALSDDLATWFSYELFKIILSQVSFHYRVVLMELYGSDLVSEKDKKEIENFEKILKDRIREAYKVAVAKQKDITDQIRNGLTLVAEFERLSAQTYVKNPIYNSFIFWQTSGVFVK